MTTYTYPELKTYAEKRGVCPVCGKRVTRRRKFAMTLNPYNRNSDGSVRTVTEIHFLLDRIAEAWEPDFTHERCAS